MAGLAAQETVCIKDLMAPRAENYIYTVDLNTFINLGNNVQGVMCFTLSAASVYIPVERYEP